MNGFKITLCLNRFFNDHRKLSRIYITRHRFNTIGSLENHIAMMLNTKKCYLLANGELLLSNEIIDVLHPNEKVEVIPFENNSEPSNSEHFNNAITARKPIQGTFLNKKRKKKIAHQRIKKMRTSNIQNVNKAYTSTPNDENAHRQTNEINDKRNKNDERILNNAKTNVKDLVEYFENNSTSSDGSSTSTSPQNKSHNTFLMSQELLQSHNIVKSIIVSNGSTNVSKPETNVTENKDNPITWKNVNILQNVVVPKTTSTTSDYIRNDSQSNPYEVHSPLVEDSLRKAKRRIRPRKKKSKKITPKPDAVPNFDIKMKSPKPNPSTYIMIDDSAKDKGEFTEVFEKKNYVENQSCDEQSHNATFELMANDISPIKTSEAMIIEPENVTSYANYSADDISQCPLVTDIPQVGSVIAFKTLKLGNNSTPEITDYIVGKITDKTIDVSLKMLSEVGVEEAKSAIKSNSLVEIENGETLTFEWRHMIDTHILP